MLESVDKMHKTKKNSVMKKELITAGKKPNFQCEICEVCFSAKRSMNAHVAHQFMINKNHIVVSFVILRSKWKH